MQCPPNCYLTVCVLILNNDKNMGKINAIEMTCAGTITLANLEATSCT